MASSSNFTSLAAHVNHGTVQTLADCNRLLKFAKEHKDAGLCYNHLGPAEQLTLVCFFDAGFSSRADGTSQGGYIVMFIHEQLMTSSEEGDYTCGRLALLEDVALFRGPGWRASQRCSGLHLQVLASPPGARPSPARPSQGHFDAEASADHRREGALRLLPQGGNHVFCRGQKNLTRDSSDEGAAARAWGHLEVGELRSTDR